MNDVVHPRAYPEKFSMKTFTKGKVEVNWK